MRSVIGLALVLLFCLGAVTVCSAPRYVNVVLGSLRDLIEFPSPLGWSLVTEG